MQIFLKKEADPPPAPPSGTPRGREGSNYTCGLSVKRSVSEGGMKKVMNDSDYILRCLELAANGEYYVAPNPMVGALLVDPATDSVVAEGWHRQYGGPHAEVECFRAADARMAGLTEAEKAARYGSLTLYVSLEPCSHYGKTPPCADLIVRKGVRRVVVGILDPNPQVSGKGVQKLRDAGIEVTVGVEQAACRRLNKRFLCLHERHRPYVILKWAQTADGFVDSRESKVESRKSKVESQSIVPVSSNS